MAMNRCLECSVVLVLSGVGALGVIEVLSLVVVGCVTCACWLRGTFGGRSFAGYCAQLRCIRGRKGVGFWTGCRVVADDVSLSVSICCPAQGRGVV